MKDESRGESVGIQLGRRYLTLLFADLSQSTELAEIMETEHYAAVLGALRSIYRETIPLHGGMVVRVQGDGMLAMFGYPVTREDDGRGAVAAALDMHQRIRELRPVLPPGRTLCLHTGIHSGLTLLSTGDMELGRFELLGPVPNIAAWLSDAAGPHEILVSEETLGPASRFFVTGPPQLLKVKGRAAPLLVYRVDARASVAESFAATARHGATAFIGRRAEIGLLEQAMDDAVAGHIRSVAVAGPPGMGKTRLVEHFLGRAMQRGCTVLRGYCESELGAVPLQPFHHMLQSVADEAQHHTPDSFAALFVRLAEQQPLLLFVDDWQWADDASHQVLAALRKRTDCRLLIVLSTRVVAVSDAPTAADQTLTLMPLSDAEALQLIAARLPRADPFVADEICRHANGNPLFLEELCHSAARGDDGQRLGRVQGGAGWLNRLVESRVQHLPPPQIELVRVAAVIGNVIPAWLLERISGQRADGPMQLGLAEHDFIFPGERAGTLRFKHGLTRAIVYESVGLAVRQDLHLRIAEAIQQHSSDDAEDEAIEALALHFDAGGDAGQAAHYAMLAGDKALAASALDRARSLYRIALAALDRLPQSPSLALRWVSIAQSLGRVTVFDPVRSEVALHERAVELAERHGDTATIARARHWLAYSTYSLGDVRTSIRQGERALAEARAAGNEKLAIQVVAALGEAHCAVAQYGRAAELLDEAIAVKGRYRSGQHINVGLAFSLVCRGAMLGDRGLFTQAGQSFDDAKSCIAGTTHVIGASVHGWLSAVLLWQGRWEDAREASDESGRIAEATRSLTQLSVARAMSAYADWMLTRRPELLQIIVDVTAWLEPRGSGLFRSLNHGWLASGMMQLGRREEARHHAARALRRGRLGDFLGAAMSYRALALEAASRRPGRVAHYLEKAMKIARLRDSAHEIALTQLCEAEIAWRHRGQRPDALLDEAMTAFARMGMAWHLAEATRLQSSIAAAGRDESAAIGTSSTRASLASG
ncbi:AAA family ATPase [Variovorax sp. J22R133]|uniref:ATP-binding protein n=1 Tax=Variovorax brevis TaxID=3053503 RepID=UPI002577436A|nr:adenylate/guanylate cyclase domain-containing protein [Variovorax sp. J22R133]MDM0117381.1 AAA family ATPase [Variovorax sp. J22R133]